MNMIEFLYSMELNENGNVEAVLSVEGYGHEFEITEKDLRRMLHLFEMKRMREETNKMVKNMLNTNF